ncbi:uncharacterized protein N7473_006414 [Penicillium subrubescens]|uniref:6-hydroxy-D-nicotine oxidase n=1 Tax=Penicillium subrubescens TaxID=1316194 RepID=A0A1Q5TCM9_9EURO|nr:uncharacterized protein N7473_006414 [Penicillium subrubescens]KAJ5897015.1 hypothetical protein N7473_006414 [Penicillium subrubescens]OKO97976.1 6-hydroxy-D-nicotine oxidase [Penicillium subrubescens]
MYHFKMQAAMAIAAWAFTTVGQNLPLGRDRLHSRGSYDMTELQSKLSSTAKVYYPNSTEFDTASARWSLLDEPKVNVVVVPGTENDVAEAVQFANQRGLPFLAYTGAHGSLTTLGKMDQGIEIYMTQLDTVTVAGDGQTATIGGGAMSKAVVDALWNVGKQAVTGTCECVSILGPGLGGGHGWLQGHHGLVADQFVSMNVVLANGTLTKIDAHSDLWWAMKGAGHNFGIVTSLTTKVFDIQHRDWAIETITFSGDKVGAVYQAANDYLLKNGTQPEGLINWSYWLNNPGADPNSPVIIFYIIQEGVTTVDSAYTEPFHNIGPISIQPASGTYTDLAGWTGIANSSPPCQKGALANPRFPIYLQSYNVDAQKKAYSVFANAVRGASTFNNSIFMFEGYSMEGVQAIASDSSAFAFRSENILAAPLINYLPAGSTLDTKVANLGNQLRDILRDGTGQDDFRAYVNYAYGDETLQELYGSESWRQSRLHALKQKYDPTGKFSFYAPIPSN